MRTSRVHYIAPSAIGITPNANDSMNDLAVNIASGTKIKVCSSGVAGLGIDPSTNSFREWTLYGRNRQLAYGGLPYTIYARLSKTNADDAYLVFAPRSQYRSGEYAGQWFDKYSFVTEDGLSLQYDSRGVPSIVDDPDYWYVRLGDVTEPVNKSRTVTLDTGILGTDQFNADWYLNPDELPLRVELKCVIGNEDAGAAPYVYWGGAAELSASLVEGWSDTDVERFDHWEITRDTGVPASDAIWNSVDRSEGFGQSGRILLSHSRTAADDFNSAVAATFVINAMGIPEPSDDSDSSDSSGETGLVVIATASITIYAETVEKYEIVLSESFMSFNPQTGLYTPGDGISVGIRATDQRGDVFRLTFGQYANAGLSVYYSPVGSGQQNLLRFSGPATSIASAVIGQEEFYAQQSMNILLVNSAGAELATGTIVFVRDGEDSKEREWIFLRSQTAITFGTQEHPSPDSIRYGEVDPPADRAARPDTDEKNQDGWVPEGWWDDTQGVSSDWPYEYAAYRNFVHGSPSDADSSDNDGGWGSFGTPRLRSHYGKDGSPSVNSSTVVLYKRSEQDIATHGIAVSTYYSFADGRLYTDSTGSTEARPNGWQRTIPEGTHPIYIIQAVASGEGGRAEIGYDEWTDPVLFAMNGQPGEDALTVTVSPATLIVNQSMSDPDNLLSLSDTFVVRVLKGETAQSINRISFRSSTDDSGNSKLLFLQAGSDTPAGVGYISGDTLTLKQIGRYTRGGDTFYFDKGYADLTVTYDTDKTTQCRVFVFATLMGEWETVVIGDTERSIARKITYAATGTAVDEIDTVGEYIRSSQQSVSRLTETVKRLGNANLFGFHRGLTFNYCAIPAIQSYGLYCDFIGELFITGDGEEVNGWHVLNGNNEEDVTKYDTIFFTTHFPNQVIAIEIEASSEEDYDYGYVGALDAAFEPRPYSSLDDVDDLSRFVSGSDRKIVLTRVAAAGDHEINVYYYKDSSVFDASDAVRYRVLDLATISNLGIAEAGGYTISFEGRVRVAACNLIVTFCGVEYTFALTTSWQFLQHTFTLTSAQALTDMISFLLSNAGSQLLIRHLKIEYGEIATKFCEADEDVQYVTKVSPIESWVYNQLVADNTQKSPDGDAVFKTNEMPTNGNYIDYISAAASLEVGKVYTLVFWAKSSTGSHTMTTYLYPNIYLGNRVDFANNEQTERVTSDGSTTVRLSAYWKKFYVHWYVMNAESGQQCIGMRILASGGANTSGIVYVAGMQLTEGYVVPDNAATSYAFSEIKQTAKEITLRVSQDEMAIAQLQLTAEGITSEVTGLKNGKNLLTGVLTGSGWLDDYGNHVNVDADNYFSSEDGTFFSPHLALENGKKYTLSFESNGFVTAVVYDASVNIYEEDFSAAGRHSLTFTSRGGDTYFMFNANALIRFPQLEVGEEATVFDSQAEEYVSQIKQTANEISFTINSGLRSAGITINGNQSKITLDASTTEIKNGDTTAAMFTNGKIVASFIDAKKVVTNALTSETIVASNATIQNLKLTTAEVSGKITATSGKIAGFDINDNTLVSSVNDDTRNARMTAENTNRHIGASIGPGAIDDFNTKLNGASYFYANRYWGTSRPYNTAVVAEAKDGYYGNFALWGIGDIVTQGLVCGYSYKKIELTYSNKYLELATTFVVKSATTNNLYLYLPAFSIVSQMFNLANNNTLNDTDNTPFVFKLTIIMSPDSDKTVKVRGVNNNPTEYSNKSFTGPIFLNNKGELSDEISMTRGDVLEVMMIYDQTCSKTYSKGNWSQGAYYSAMIVRFDENKQKSYPIFGSDYPSNDYSLYSGDIYFDRGLELLKAK